MYYELLPEFLKKDNGKVKKLFLAIEDFLSSLTTTFSNNVDIKNLANLSQKLLELFCENYGVDRFNFSDAELKAMLFAKLSGNFEGNDTQKMLNVLNYFFPTRQKAIRLLNSNYFDDNFVGLKIPRAIDIYLENLNDNEIPLLRRLLRPIKPAGVIVTFNFKDRTPQPYKITEIDFQTQNITDAAILSQNKAVFIEDNAKIDFSATSEIFSGNFPSPTALGTYIEILSYVYYQRGYYFALNRANPSTGIPNVVIFSGNSKSTLGTITPPSLSLTTSRFRTQYYIAQTGFRFGYEYTSSNIRVWRHDGATWSSLATYTNTTIIRANHDLQNVGSVIVNVGKYSEITPNETFAISLFASGSNIVAHRTYNAGSSWALQTVGAGAQATVSLCQGHFTIKTNSGFFISPISSTSYTSRPTVNVANSPIHFAIENRLWFLQIPSTSGSCTIYYSDDLGQTLTQVTGLLTTNRVAYFGTIHNLPNAVILVTKTYSGTINILNGFRFVISFDNGSQWINKTFTLRASATNSYNNIEFYGALYDDKNRIIYFFSERPYTLALQLNADMDMINLAVTNTHYYSGGLEGFAGFPASANDFRASNFFGQINRTSPNTEDALFENLYCYSAINSSAYSLRYAKVPFFQPNVIEIKANEKNITVNRAAQLLGVRKIQEFETPNFLNISTAFLTSLPSSSTSEQKQNQNAGRFRSFSLLPYDENLNLVSINVNYGNLEGGAAGGVIVRNYPPNPKFRYIFLQGVNARQIIQNESTTIYANLNSGVNTEIRTIAFKNFENRILSWDFLSGTINKLFYQTGTSDQAVNDTSFDLRDENGVSLPPADKNAQNKNVIKIDETSFAMCYFVNTQLRISVHSFQTGRRLAYYTYNFDAVKTYSHRALVCAKKYDNNYVFVFGYAQGFLIISDLGAKDFSMPTWPSSPPYLADLQNSYFGNIIICHPNSSKIYILSLEVEHVL